MEFDYVELFGYAGSAFTLAAVFQKTMNPLRFFNMCSNCLMIVYAVQLELPAILIVQCILLPLNTYRFYEMRKLVKDVKKSAAGDLSVDWLIPYMSKTSGKKDEVLFRKGDTADSLYYIQKGEVYLPEIDAQSGPGSIIGEIGLFSPEGLRTTSVVCREDCVILKITAEKVRELYHQNPDFGFYMIRIVAQRLMRDIRSLEEELEARKAS